jgi:acyl-CoA reductase-like NAD-dependent aldehyde dehydrogenase
VIVDVTGLTVPDREVFAPVLSVRRVGDFAAAWPAPMTRRSAFRRA